MDTIPQLPPLSLSMDGYGALVVLLGIVSLAALAGAMVIFGLILWDGPAGARERVRLICPSRLRPVRVVFKLRADGRREDVLRCSVFGRRPMSCGKVCLHTAASI